jgi:hypothetical protein
MFTTLKSVGIPFNDRRVTYRLHKEQLAVVNCSGNVEEAKMRKGVRQGCALLPMLFNVFIEKAMNEIKKLKTGVQVHGEKISMLRFADGIAIVAE